MRLADIRHKIDLPFHVVKKLDVPRKTLVLTRVVGILVAFLLAGVICTILRPGTFGTFYQQMILGCFDPSTPEKLLEFLMCASLLMLVAFALAPAFKMKFWNIGGEGQILVGVLATAALCRFMGKAGISDGIIIPVSLLTAVAAGIIWAIIPAIFKAFFGTNETLFTLMMNYIAAGLIAILINVWVPNGSQMFGDVTSGNLPDLFNVKFLSSIIITAVIVAIMIIYLKLTKHGYEIAVVGESANTARYIGINVKKVTIRTMAVSGAICGIVGFLLVAGYHHTLTNTLSDGRGFTGVLVAWLGGFQPLQMIMFSFLVAIFQRGSFYAASEVGMSTTYFSAIVTGMFFLVVIASTFFINYRVMFKPRHHKKDEPEMAVEGPQNEENPVEEAPSEEIKEDEPAKEEKKQAAPKKKTTAKKQTKNNKKEDK